MSRKMLEIAFRKESTDVLRKRALSGHHDTNKVATAILAERDAESAVEAIEELVDTITQEDIKEPVAEAEEVVEQGITIHGVAESDEPLVEEVVEAPKPKPKTTRRKATNKQK